MSRFEYLDLPASSSAIGKFSSTSLLLLIASAKDLLALAAQLQVILDEVTRLFLLLTTHDTAKRPDPEKQKLLLHGEMQHEHHLLILK